MLQQILTRRGDLKMGARYFGAKVMRAEDENLITGRGQYVDDIQLTGMMHGAFLRSPHAHAQVKNIDVSRAQKMMGVHAVFTYDDLSGPLAEPLIQTYSSPSIKQDIRPYLLAKDEVCYVGEAVAFVVADTRHLAEDALTAIDVEFETLEPAVDLYKASREDAPLAHTSAPNNLASSLNVKYGEVDGAFAGADHVLSTSFTQHRGGCHSMECRGVVATYDMTADELKIWSSTQCPYLIRRALAQQLGMPDESVRVIAPDVGGGFGPKAGYYVEEAIVPFAAKILGHPVKWIEDRREHFLSTNTQRDTIWDLEIAASNEGRILGVRGKVLLDNGAYVPYGLLLPITTLIPLPGPYRVHALDVTLDVVLTNTVCNSPIRGAGRPNAAYAMERVVETIARGLNIESTEVRRRNFVRKEDFPYQTGLIHFNGRPITYDSGDYHGLLEKAMELADFDGFSERQRAARAEGRYLGIGISSCIEDTGIGPYEGVTVRVDTQGKVHVLTGAASQGQGHKTVISQIVADELGIAFEDVKVQIGDTGKFPQGIGTVGSRVGVNAGTSSYSAAVEVREKALSLAAQILEAEAGDLEIEDGIVRDTGNRNINISLGDLALKLAPMTGGPIPEGFKPSLEATSYETSKDLPTASGSNVCEVDVDVGTGEVRILRYSVAHDCGRKINPMIVEGQIIGGVIHGIGNALFEQMLYDERGQPLTTNYGEYLMPLGSEMPRVDIVHQETPSPLNPLGLKGAGEGGTIPAAAAVVSAIENALEPFGIEIDYYPVTPQRLCELLDEAEQALTAAE
jgi:carbon-monoxide dehydrogenase large subunit